MLLLPLLLPNMQVYGLPFNGTHLFQRHIGKPLRTISLHFCCCCCCCCCCNQVYGLPFNSTHRFQRHACTDRSLVLLLLPLLLLLPNLQVYGLPFNGTRLFQRHVGKPLRAWSSRNIGTPCARAFAPLRRSCHGCCPRRKQHSDPITTLGLTNAMRPDGQFNDGPLDGQCYEGKLPTSAPGKSAGMEEQQQQQQGGAGSSAGSSGEHITVRMELSNHGSKA
jgi:hypothetical protein